MLSLEEFNDRQPTYFVWIQDDVDSIYVEAWLSNDEGRPQYLDTNCTVLINGLKPSISILLDTGLKDIRVTYGVPLVDRTKHTIGITYGDDNGNEISFDLNYDPLFLGDDIDTLWYGDSTVVDLSRSIDPKTKTRLCDQFTFYYWEVDTTLGNDTTETYAIWDDHNIGCYMVIDSVTGNNVKFGRYMIGGESRELWTQYQTITFSRPLSRVNEYVNSYTIHYYSEPRKIYFQRSDGY